MVLDTNTLLAELLDVLSREKFAASQVVARLIDNDADDAHVLACALAGQADLIVSGDRHLLGLGGQYQDIPIVTPARAAQQIGI
ncbi:MAG: PIN domain-containing protein [Sterolibacterium sp.]